MLVFSSGGKANDTDVDYACHEATKDIEESAEKKFEVFERSFLKMIRPVELRGFQFPEDRDVLCRKGADGRQRSNLFAASVMLFTKEKMHFYKRSVSLTEGGEPQNDTTIMYYTKLGKAFLEEGDYKYIRGNRQYNVHTYQFVVTDAEGNDVYRMFVDYGADTDKAVSEINHVFEVRKKALEERAAERAAEKAAREAAIASQNASSNE